MSRSSDGPADRTAGSADRFADGHPWAHPLDVDGLALWSVTQVSEAADALARQRGLPQGWAAASTAQVRAAFRSTSISGSMVAR